ncbi:hypothetical protein RF11_08595 [Thelohanellus kitauei]|uniref:Uncharacterized protein n=1 Tax=Thelohanellus kitauei TaxID=669202 RepID=A0A0C2JFK5_THEKT|nr:hypothetical protein RF11_08595 [Thelohanellus kitauei]
MVTYKVSSTNSNRKSNQLNTTTSKNDEDNKYLATNKKVNRDKNTMTISKTITEILPMIESKNSSYDKISAMPITLPKKSKINKHIKLNVTELPLPLSKSPAIFYNDTSSFDSSRDYTIKSSISFNITQEVFISTNQSFNETSVSNNKNIMYKNENSGSITINATPQDMNSMIPDETTIRTSIPSTNSSFSDYSATNDTLIVDSTKKRFSNMDSDMNISTNVTVF